MSVLELRTYEILPGCSERLMARFRDHTDALFRTHGMTPLGYWTSLENPDRLIYLLRHEGDPTANWNAFRDDPRWITARAESVAEGELTASIASELLADNALSALVDETR
ncbi:NIPSNAP family protein [Microbacterium chocolatum]|uniref:NIPSNAP family protein n=1 Tax=Microbacterium aurantiacum TaxID=162393 RepID=UPI00338E35C2